MRLFFDTSVLLAACGSPTGASRTVIDLAPMNGWRLLQSSYVETEVRRNLPRIKDGASAWNLIRPRLQSVRDEWTLDRPVVFEPTKDRPVLFTALANADVLLTLDRADFIHHLGRSFYALALLKPGTFLNQQRAQGTLIEG